MTESMKETRTRAIFNVAMLLKGSGINTGISLSEGSKTGERNKILAI